MTNGPRVTLSRGVAFVAAVALLSAGAFITWLFLRQRPEPASDARHSVPAVQEAATRESGAAPAQAAAAQDGAPLPDVAVPLSSDLVNRTGIVVAPVSIGETIPTLRIPGVVEPNAYKQVDVTPIAGGRVTRVSAELGASVRRGQTLAQVYSPELAEAQTRLIALRAEFDAAERQVNRTRRLVEIGAASRQELEQVHAEHAGHAAALAGARSRLVLLGMSPEAIARLSQGADVTATISVPAPFDGIVTMRAANVGLNVDPSTKLFTVVDLATVWAVGDLYERDFLRVRVGSAATVRTAAYPDLALEGRVSYIDPQVNAQTRTARVRVEVANPKQELRLGMLAQIDIRAEGASNAITVPRDALQTVGDRQMVYLADPAVSGRFIEREVQVGARVGERAEIVAGLKPGDRVVTKGSFFVRAERERLGLRASAGAMAGHAADVQATQVVVSERGFEPARVALKAGVPARLEFLRTTDMTCATEIVIPGIDVRKPLPLNQPVTVDIPAREAGELTFACGMDMVTGVAVFSK